MHASLAATHAPTPAERALQWSLVLAACGPMLLAFNQPPSPTVLNQVVALAGWGAVLMTAALGSSSALRHALSRSMVLACALMVLIACALWSSALRGLPWSLGLSHAGMLGCALLALVAGAAIRPGVWFWRAFFGAWVLAGAASAVIALVQVFAPTWPDGVLIARSALPSRAVGNLRQSNQLATLLMWSVVALIPLIESRPAGTRRAVATWVCGTIFALLLLGVMLSGSRTGLLALTILVLWGALDRRLSRLSRLLLIASPLICAAQWWLLDLWSAWQGVGAIGAAARVGEGDVSGARFLIWRDTLALIAMHPLAGVGLGEFNFAWSLTPFPNRNGEFFDHTHDMPLQLAVELGIPLALIVLGLMVWALWQGLMRCRAIRSSDGIALRAAFMMVLLVLLHSLLEYPLWYAYFLLPAAFVWGLCLSAGAQLPPAASRVGLRAMGLALALVAVVVSWDFHRVVSIFSPHDEDSSLAERIEDGRRSILFAHHAEYAWATYSETDPTPLVAFARAPHYLLDTRLMVAWARALATQGDVERARHIAARVREFHNPLSDGFFSPCISPGLTPVPFQCEAPSRKLDWRDFR